MRSCVMAFHSPWDGFAHAVLFRRAQLLARNDNGDDYDERGGLVLGVVCQQLLVQWIARRFERLFDGGALAYPWPCLAPAFFWLLHASPSVKDAVCPRDS